MIRKRCWTLFGKPDSMRLIPSILLAGFSRSTEARTCIGRPVVLPCQSERPQTQRVEVRACRPAAVTNPRRPRPSRIAHLEILLEAVYRYLESLLESRKSGSSCCKALNHSLLHASTYLCKVSHHRWYGVSASVIGMNAKQSRSHPVVARTDRCSACRRNLFRPPAQSAVGLPGFVNP